MGPPRGPHTLKAAISLQSAHIWLHLSLSVLHFSLLNLHQAMYLSTAIYMILILISHLAVLLLNRERPWDPEFRNHIFGGFSTSPKSTTAKR